MRALFFFFTILTHQCKTTASQWGDSKMLCCTVYELILKMLFCRCFLEYLIHKECSKSKNKRETVLKHSSVIFNIKKKLKTLKLNKNLWFYSCKIYSKYQGITCTRLRLGS